MLDFRAVACVFNYHVLDFDVSGLGNQVVDGDVDGVDTFALSTLRGSVLLDGNCLIGRSCVVEAILDAILLLELVICCRITGKFGAVVELESHTRVLQLVPRIALLLLDILVSLHIIEKRALLLVVTVGRSLIPLLHGVNILGVLLLLDAASLALACEGLVLDHLGWKQVLLVVDFCFFTWLINNT